MAVRLDKSGTDGTSYSVVAAGGATTDLTNASFAGGAQSRTGWVGINTASGSASGTAVSGTVTVDNLAADSSAAGRGSADANDVFNVSGKVFTGVAGRTLTFGLVGGGVDYAGLSTRVDAGGGLAGTQLTLLAGSNPGSGPAALQSRWRAAGENWPESLFLSDVVDLTGVAGVFAMQMTYLESLLQPGVTEQMLVDQGALHIVWYDTDAGAWVNAVEGNSAVGSNAQSNFQGSWDAFATAHSIDASNLSQFLGSWGVDTTANVAWAVLDHNSEFAVIPEPSTLVLAGLGLLGLLLLWRRRRSG